MFAPQVEMNVSLPETRPAAFSAGEFAGFRVNRVDVIVEFPEFGERRRAKGAAFHAAAAAAAAAAAVLASRRLDGRLPRRIPSILWIWNKGTIRFSRIFWILTT